MCFQFELLFMPGEIGSSTIGSLQWVRFSADLFVIILPITVVTEVGMGKVVNQSAQWEFWKPQPC